MGHYFTIVGHIAKVYIIYCPHFICVNLKQNYFQWREVKDEKRRERKSSRDEYRGERERGSREDSRYREDSRKSCNEKSLLNSALGSCCEFGRRDDANAWRKSTKEADNTKKIFIAISKVKISPCIGVIMARTHTKDLVSVGWDRYFER